MLLVSIVRVRVSVLLLLRSIILMRHSIAPPY